MNEDFEKYIGKRPEINYQIIEGDRRLVPKDYEKAEKYVLSIRQKIEELKKDPDNESLIERLHEEALNFMVTLSVEDGSKVMTKFM